MTWCKTAVNTLKPRQNERHFADDIFKCILAFENVWIPITISLKSVPESPINGIPALVQIMAWRRPGDKPLSEPMMVSLPTHMCVTRPQWVNSSAYALDMEILQTSTKPLICLCFKELTTINKHTQCFVVHADTYSRCANLVTVNKHHLVAGSQHLPYDKLSPQLHGRTVQASGRGGKVAHYRL